MVRTFMIGIVCCLLACTATASGVATRDTTFLLGGPERWDGRFETPGGQPDWHGWTYAEGYDPHWQISSYNVPPDGGNYAMWCGKTHANACAEGYGNNWNDQLVFTDTVADPSIDNTIGFKCVFNCDTEPGHDQLVFQMLRNDQWETFAGPYDGLLVGEIVDVQVTFHPEDYVGPFGGIFQFRALVTTDGEGSDEDCLLDTQGACQIDNLEVTHPDGFQRFEDYEDQSGEFWHPVLPPDYVAPELTANLPEQDPDQDNSTWQVNWLNYDDPPGDPNHTFWGLIFSPPLAVPDQVEEMILACDFGWNHDDLTLFHEWHVRSTASSDPQDLDQAEWLDRDYLYFSVPGYHRLEQPMGDLLVPGAQWMQVSLEAFEFVMGLDPDLQGDALPYFDNVVVKAAVSGGTTDAPAEHRLSARAYPNPFNPRTTIMLENPIAGPAELTVFDLRGRLVRRLLIGDIAAGHHEFTWDGRDETGRSAAAGSYLCRARAGGRMSTVRLTLVR